MGLRVRNRPQGSAARAEAHPSVQRLRRAAAASSPPPCTCRPDTASAASRARRVGAASMALRDASSLSLRDLEAAAAEGERVGVLLLNLGGPETLDDVQPFLYNLFSDPDIIRLPPAVSFLQRPLAALISTLRAPKSSEGYAAIGGGSPLRRITDEQAAALRGALAARGTPARVYVAMRYWRPFTEDAVAAIKRDRITRLVVLPLYPQFSISTSGSSLRLLEALFKSDPYLRGMKHTVIPSWYNRPGYINAMAGLVQGSLASSFTPEEAPGAVIFFSAHGVPESYVREAGDPYKEEIEQCVALIMAELQSRGVGNAHKLAYQSRVGPVEWLKPYTDSTIRELGAAGTPALLAVPISFVSEHIETLEEIDCEYRELAHESGIAGWGRVPALNCEASFIGDLADAVIEALPYAEGSSVAPAPGGRGAPAGEHSLVPVGSVEDLLATYDGERLRLPPPIVIWRWRWGWTRSAEVWNGRLAMVAVASLLALELSSGKGVLHTLGLM